MPSRVLLSAGNLQPAPSLPGDVSQRLHQVTSAPLESPWLAAALLLAGTAVLVRAVHVTRRRRRLDPAERPGRPRTVAAIALGLSLLAGGALCGVNAYVGYIPTWEALANQVDPAAADKPEPARPKHLAPYAVVRSGAAPQMARGRIERILIADPAHGVPSEEAFVYLPPGYDDLSQAGRRYPTVYLIHGYPGSPIDWVNGGRIAETMDVLLAQHLVQPMILVAPSASTSWQGDTECLDAVHGPEMETYLTQTVVHAIDGRFRTIPEATSRAVGGMSSGGFCALNLGLRHQDTFSVILAEEPYGDPGQQALHKLLGGDRALFRANSPSAYIPTMRFQRQMAVFLDAPGDRGSVSATRAIAEALVARGLTDVTFRVVLGAKHNWHEPRLGFPYAAVFASEQLQADASARLAAGTT